MKKPILLISLLMLFLIGCSTKYQVIDQIQANNEELNENIILSHKGFNPSKKIFAKLDKELSDDFIYIFSWVNHLPMASDHFTALVYDRKSKRTFYINNSLEDKNSIEIREKTTNHKEERIVLDYYLKNKIDSLISLPPTFEMGSRYTLFGSRKKEAFVVKNIELDENGKIINPI